MTLKRVRAVVSGRVQGVFFRAFTQKEAERLRLTGWTRNLPDTTVEVLMEGDQEAVNSMLQWLHQGSPMATVDSITTEEQQVLHDRQDFTIRY
ncbi:acylphosphatase [Thermodesulfobacteriota bacterium]